MHSIPGRAKIKSRHHARRADTDEKCPAARLEREAKHVMRNA